LKPLVVGVITGDLLAGLIFLTHSAIYCAVTGLLPKIYRVFPP
jgi:hypothetical protein